jgi:D-sedoheptulose 7-phosphate isomerase
MTANSKEYTSNFLNESLSAITELKNRHLSEIESIIDALVETRKKGGKIFIFGNGGSASTATHFAADLAKTTINRTSPRFKAVSLTDNIALITAWSNDTSYTNIFKEQLENLLSPEDLVIGISCSGTSKNVIAGIEYANSTGAFTVGLSMGTGGKLRDSAKICLCVPTTNIMIAESVHLLVHHLITSVLLNDEYK